MIDVDIVIPLHRADRPIFETVASTTAEVQGVTTRAIVVLHNLELEPALRDALEQVATVLSVADGIPSPSGPRNAGLERATAPYVFFLDSDDVLDRHCLARLHAVAEATSADVVLPSVQDGAHFLGTPLAFRRSTTRLDLVRHHLFMRSHVPALLRRSTLVDTGVRYPAGVRTGQDFVMMAELYATGTIAMAFDAVYVMADDGGERVSQTPLPPDQQLAAVRAIATSRWARALPHEQRLALAQRILSINLAGGWRRKQQMGHPLSAETHDEIRALACDLGPGALALLSVRDRTTLRFRQQPGRFQRLLMSKPFGLVPTSWRGTWSPLGPVSVQLRSSIVRHRRRRGPAA